MSRREKSASWDPVANWYIGIVGKRGSAHHRELAIPAVMDLLAPESGEQILDVGCGPGVLAPHVAKVGACYTGVDASPRLIGYARKHHRKSGIFLLGDATDLPRTDALQPSAYDAVVFLLSIQDISPLDAAIASAAWALRRGGRLVILMTHPCFRVPWHSGWEWDRRRRLQFRRVERYIRPFSAPMREYKDGRSGATRSYHRPLTAYVNALASHGLLIDRLQEIPAAGERTMGKRPRGERPTSERPTGERPTGERPTARRTSDLAGGKGNPRAEEEIPLFLAIRAIMAPSRRE